MTQNHEAVLKVFTFLYSKYKKAYCFPSQEKILELLKEYYGVTISRRTLNRVLKWLQVEGFFDRIKRHYQKSSGELVCRSTLYIAKAKLIKWLHKLRRFTLKTLDFIAVPPMAQYSNTRLSSSVSSADLSTGYQQPEQPKKDFPIKLNSPYDLEVISAEEFRIKHALKFE